MSSLGAKIPLSKLRAQNLQSNESSLQCHCWPNRLFSFIIRCSPISVAHAAISDLPLHSICSNRSANMVFSKDISWAVIDYLEKTLILGSIAQNSSKKICINGTAQNLVHRKRNNDRNPLARGPKIMTRAMNTHTYLRAIFS